MKKKTALITGVTGQCGSYLAELLLKKGYHVVGVKRRTSTFNTERVDPIFDDPNFKLEYGNMIDGYSLYHLLNVYKPDEIYNAAAQSHVRVSFEVPEETLEVVGGGTLRLLNAMKEVCPKSKFFQFSSSEMFGDSPEVPQTEHTRMMPASPYAAAKLYAHNICRNYRVSYGMHISTGIIFNNECVEYHTPIIIKKNNEIDVVRPVDLVALRKKGTTVQTFPLKDIAVWDGNGWTKLISITATKKHDIDDHKIQLIQTRGGTIATTSHHNLLTHEYCKIRADNIIEQQKLALSNSQPPPEAWTTISKNLAEFLGYMTGDGYIPKEDRNLQFTNNDPKLQRRVIKLWSKLFLGQTRTGASPSGFKSGNHVTQIYLTGNNMLCRWFRSLLYNCDGYKKVPNLILNASKKIQNIYLKAYYACDGLKKGNGKSFASNSAVLARGLVWMYGLQGYSCTHYVQEHNGALYYYVNLGVKSNRGRHLKKPKNTVRKKTDISSYITTEWVFDLETESGIFNAGVGDLVIHNSPRRGETFVTRKITLAAARIKLGLQETLELGNLDAKRDWGYTPDYMECVHLIMQQQGPDDYIVSTGETHSVKEFLHEVFKLADLDPEKHVKINPRLFRPHEVPILCGESSRTRAILNWKPRVKFKDLAKIMYEADLILSREEL